jgi:dynein heavy chain
LALATDHGARRARARARRRSQAPAADGAQPRRSPWRAARQVACGGGECIRLGDATIEYQKEFKFYIATKLRNPHYLPELHYLEVLSGEGNILEDAKVINILGAAKVLGNEIADKQKIVDETEIKIDIARNGYKPVVYRTSLLYFCITVLSDVDPMYQYSLDCSPTSSPARSPTRRPIATSRSAWRT